jgi:phenylpropionate dioxygenase-like ring-hydroxylating dioxygenase large terminal subunit
MLTETDLARRIGPRLNDGTFVGELIDVQKREVAMRVFSDPEIYQLELERIFNRSWLKVGHVNEIPNPGDYMLANMGEDSVIVIRGRDDVVRILLNVCAHRGMEVCWGQRGNTRTFMCPYHSWVFNDTGKLVAAPLKREMYGPDWDRTDYGLKQVRTAFRHGYIFGNFDDTAVSFEDWMGEDFLFYFDAHYEGHEHYVPLTPPTESLFKANWKIGVDQNTGDAYHALGTHKAIAEAGVIPNNGLRNMCDTLKITFPGYGHTVMGFGSPFGVEGLDGVKYPWHPAQIGVQVVFPASGGAGARTWSPRGPGAHTFMLQTFVAPDVSEPMRDAMRSGIAAQLALAIDDADAYESIQRSANRGFGRHQTMKYNATMPPNRPDHWPDRGEVRAGFSRDDGQWSWWLRYFDMMTADEG